MNISFVALQSCKKGAEHLRLLALKVAFRNLIEYDMATQNNEKSQTIVQTQSQFVGKSLKDEVLQQQNEMYESEPNKKNKQMTFLQNKIRNSTIQQDVNRQAKLEIGEQLELDSPVEVEVVDQEIKLKKLMTTKLVHNEEYKDRKLENHRQVEPQMLQFDDVFVIKTTNAGSASYNVKSPTAPEIGSEMIVIGNSAFKSSINCVSMANQVINSPYALQQKCFFRIRNPRTVSNNQNHVHYGQRILLEHIQSEQYLSVNLDTPAQERGSFAVKLQPQQTYYSMLRILPASNSKKIGDKIHYNEQMIIQEDSTRQYYLRLDSDETRSLVTRFIDINAGDTGDLFKLHRVANSFNPMVEINHLERQYPITITDKQFAPFLSNKPCLINNSQNDQQQSQLDSFTIRQFDIHKYLSQEQEVFSGKQAPLVNSYCLFELQPIFPFTDQQSSPHSYRLKSVFTQQYLSIDPNDERKFRLTNNIKNEYSIFHLIPEKSQGDEQVVSIQSCLNTYLSLRNNIKLQFEHVADDQNPQQFSIKPVNKQTSNLFEDFNEISNGLLNFHVFLQQWAILTDKRKQNEEILVFDYLRALQQKVQLDLEITHLESYLVTLHNHLSPKPYIFAQSEEQQDTISVAQVHAVIKEQKILEMLFAIVRLIDNLIYTSAKSLKDKDKPRLYKPNRALPPAQSASQIALKALNLLPIQIYQIIYLSVKNSPINQRTVLDNDEFLCQQVRNYGSKVAKILKAAVKDTTNIELTDWVKLLEPLDELNNNIYDMTVHLQVIAIGLVDSHDQGIIRNQNKVCKELFSQGKNGKTKYLFMFSLLADKPTFSLYREDPLHEFLIRNPSLSALHMIRNSDANEEMYSLEELGEKIQVRKSLMAYSNYLTAAINLLAQLCKGRNKKCIKKVLFQGVTASHIYSALRSTEVPLNMKNSYLKLYQVLYVDVDPFLRLESQQCFIWDQLQVQTDMKTVQIFNHYVEPAEAGKLTKEFEERMLPLLFDLLLSGQCLQDGLIKMKKKSQTNMRLSQLKPTTVMPQDKKHKSKRQQKIKFLTSLFNLIYKAIQFGYMTQAQICEIISPMVQVFLPFMSPKERQALNLKENWLSELVDSTLKSGELIDYLDELFQVGVLLIKQFFQVQINIQIQEFVYHFQQSYKSYCLQNLSTLVKEVQQVLNQMLVGDSHRSLLQNILLCLYCSNWPTELKGSILCKEALSLGLNQNWMQKLRQVEIIYGDELELYMQMTGNSLVGQIFSPIRLEFQIQQLEDEQQKKKDEKSKDEQTLEIDNQLNKLINRINEMKMDPFFLTKTQNILRNLLVDKSILRLLRLRDTFKQQESDKVQQPSLTQSIAIKFLCLFVINNEINAEGIKDELPNILKLAQYNYKVAKLVGILCTSQKNQSANQLQQNYREIFKAMFLYKPSCTQLYGTLTAIIQDNFKNKRSERVSTIKREILSNLFKSPSYISDLQYYKQFMDLKTKKEEQSFYQGDFKTYQAASTLTAQVIQDYSLGVEQVQSVLVMEQINMIFYSPGTPFLLKTEIIKLLYHTQIQNVQTFTMNDMRDLLIVILNELLNFPKYFEGILRNYEPKNQIESEILMEDRNFIEAMKVKVFSEQEEKKKNMLATAPGPTSTQNAAQQQAAQINEQKKIISDSTEYWKYLLSWSNWKNVEFGAITFITQLFEEIIIRKWNVQETQQQLSVIQSEQTTQQNEESLYEPLALIKVTLDNMKNSMSFLDNQFQYPKHNLYITKLQYTLGKCIIKCPLLQNLKNLKINKYNQEFKTLQAIKSQIKSMRNKIAKKLTNEEQKQGMSQFYEKLRNYMINKHYTVNYMLNSIKGHFQFDQEAYKDENIYIIDAADKLVSKEVFCNLFMNIIDEHQVELIRYRQVSKQSLSESQKNYVSQLITTEDVSRYYEAYLQLRESTKHYLDINKFYAKFVDYIESKKVAYDKELLKKDQQKSINDKTQRQESQFIKQTFDGFLDHYDLLINPLNSQNFYKLDKECLESVANQFHIKLINQENLQFNFQKQIINEAVSPNKVAVTILHALLEKKHLISDIAKLTQFAFKLVPSLFFNFKHWEQEFHINDLDKVRQIVQTLLSIQELDSDNFARVFQNENTQYYIKFMSRIFNQADRLLNLAQDTKDSPTAFSQSIFFYTKSTQQTDKNRLLSKLLQIIQHILRFTANLFQGSSMNFNEINLASSFLEEVLYFTSNYFNYINRLQLTHISTEYDVMIIYSDCLQVLNNFSVGSSQNQQIILNHKPLTPLIQQIITSQKYDLLSNNLVDLQYRKLFQVCLQLLLQVQDDTTQLFSELNYQVLFEKLIGIYDTFSNRIKIIIKGQKCLHLDSVNCTSEKCADGYLAAGEEELFGICFNIMIFFNIVSRNAESLLKQERKKDYWKPIKGASYTHLTPNQKRNISFITLFYSIGQFVKAKTYDAKREELLQEYLIINHHVLQSIEISDKVNTRFNMKAPNYGSRTPPLQSSLNNKGENSIITLNPKMKFKESIYKITGKNRNKIKLALDEAVPFKKFEDGADSFAPSQYGVPQQNKVGAKINNAVLHWYEDTQSGNQKDIKKRRFSMKMARSISFVGQFIGSVQIYYGEIMQLYFILPFSNCFLLKSTLKRAQHLKISCDKNDELILMTEYIQQEIIFRQKLQDYHIINQLSLNYDKIVVFNYLLAVTINLLYLIDYINLDGNQQLQTAEIPIVVLTTLMLITTLFILGLTVINQHSYLSFRVKNYKTQINQTQNLNFEITNKPQQVRQIKSHRFSQITHHNGLLAHLTSSETVYYFIYFIISIISIFIPPVVSLLMFDLVNRSKDLRLLLNAIKLNASKLIQLFILVLFVFYAYAFLAFSSIPAEYIPHSKNEHLYFIFLYFVEYGLKLHDVLVDGDEQENVSWGIYMFAITLFILIVILSFAIVIGLISGTYANTKDLLHKQKNRYCRVCGITQQECRQKNIIWKDHKYNVHSLANYLFFINQVQIKNNSKCNQIERDIKQKLLVKDMSWLPNKSYFL